MNKEKMYFKSIDDNICYSLESQIDDARYEGLATVKLVEAIPDNDNNDHVWCSHYEYVEEKSLCSKNNCPAYISKSGRGICSSRGYLYRHGDEVEFKVEK